MPKSQHTKLYRNVALELRVARIRSGMTQKQAAERIGERQSYISKIEMAERRVDVVELKALCAIYNLTVADFLNQVGIK